MTILRDLKTSVNLSDNYTPFDEQILLLGNAVIASLIQVGELSPMSITENTTWGDLQIKPDILGAAQGYLYAKLRLLFDPPQSSYYTTALNDVCKEYEWRFNFDREVNIDGTGTSTPRRSWDEVGGT